MKEVQIFLTLQDIKILVYNINLEEIQSLKDGLDKDKLKFKTSNNFEIDLDKEIVRVNPELIFEYDLDKIVLCTLKCKYEYHIGGLKNLIKVSDTNSDKKNISIPNDLFLMLINSSISTSRGILFIKNAGTPLENHYYPMVDPTTLLPVDIKRS